MKITNEEWMEISNQLEPYHAVFYRIWQMGKPIISDAISTAAVRFDEEGKFVEFIFNPELWKKSSLTKKLFIICHESLHIILNHGVRGKDSGVNGRAANVAMDVVINHLLTRNFDFKREEIDEDNEYCWVDTVFGKNDVIPSDKESFEFYYNLFDKQYGDGDMGDGSGQSPQTVDNHESWNSKESSTDWSKAIEKLNSELSDEEKESLKTTIKKHFQKSKSENPDNNLLTPAGHGTGNWTFISGKKAQKKRKWETVVKKWASKYIKEDSRDVEQWARLNRRMCMLPKTMMLPSEMEIDDRYEDNMRIDVFFFLDTSGSCWNLKDRFFHAAESLPENRFNVRLFCFDTSVVETNLEDRRVYGGGGTCFDIIERHIQKIIQSENIKYPHAVWLLTDGYGTHVNPQFPDRWHWFLTEGAYTNYIDQKSLRFNLADYE